jgi:hypothetical protein
MKGGLDAQIEGLYRLPLPDFTAARNALAKGAGQRAAEVRDLGKPPLPAWAVNQLYWQRRKTYDALMDAAQEMRGAHAAVLGGQSADVRAAGKEHEAQVSAAVDAAIEILKESGHPVTDATRQSLVTTLRALPSDEAPGMLTRTLQPGGFEALAGLSIKGAVAPPAVRKPEPKAAASAPKETAREARARDKAEETLAHATRVMKEAEHDAQRQEFERVRTAKDQERAKKAIGDAEEALEDAKRALDKAISAHAAARKKTEAAERRAEEAEQAADMARERLKAARAVLDKL